MKVNIPNPCSENWAEMSSTERGAFCQKCAVDVIDFSKKNAQEVKETLQANMGKHMCGRFTTSQLTDLSQAYQIWENQSARTFQSKFLWACMIAFGFTLFTGCEHSIAQNNKFDVFNSQEINMNVGDSTKTDTTIVPQNINDSIDFTDFIMGDYEAEPEIMWLGEPAIQIDEIDEILTTESDSTKQDSTVIESNCKPLIQPQEIEYIKGKIAAPARFNDYLADTLKVENIKSSIETEKIQAMIYPNPTTDVANLKVQVNDNEHYAIELFNFQGAHLTTIFVGVMRKNERTFKVDLSDYPTGTYLVKITSNSAAHALKVNKVN